MTVHVLNARTLALSTYSTAGVLSVIEHGGETYFVTATGLMKLDPAADMTTASYIQTGDLTLRPGYRVNLWRVSADLSADAPMRLTTQLHIAGQSRDIAYTVPERSSAQSRSRVIELGRGPRAEEWSIKLGTTAEGGNWALTSMAVYPGAMKQGR